MTTAPDVSAQSFAAWNIALPDEAVAERRDGMLHAAGWQVRYRWHADGSLEYRAGHRMTNERWAIIGPDGDVSNLPVPAEFMVTPPTEWTRRVTFGPDVGPGAAGVLDTWTNAGRGRRTWS